MPTAKINGIDINYKIKGDGEPLVMIMGIASTKSAWILQTPVLRKHFKVITFDNRGCGESGKPSEPYSIRDMADDTAGLMDFLEIDKAHVLGVSMGGMIAQELAINHPDKVNRLILCCTFAKRTGIGGISSRLVDKFGYEGDYSYDDLLNMPIRNILLELQELAFNKKINRLFIVPLMRLWIRNQDVSGITNQLKAIWEHDSVDRLALIKARTLLMTGTDDKIIDSQSSELLVKHIPGSNLVKYEGGSHAFFVEMRKRFNSEVIHFLKDE
ncbi:MAG: alpha/beta fold hydrolase [Peptococcaceae bacterium]